MDGTGQVPATLQQAISSAVTVGGLVPPGTMYVSLVTPLGNANVDPFAAAQDPTTQSILQALGISVQIGLGTPPPELTAAPSLTSNLLIVALVVGGLLLLRRR